MTTATLPTPPTSTGAARGDSGRPSTRLPGVDGLRALAAMWVVLFHMRAFSGASIKGIPGADLVVRSGSTGVSLFLVLSGFCLYVPFAGGRTDRFRTLSFLRRRAARLYPAYVASLVFTLGLSAAVGSSIGLAQPGAGDASVQLLSHLTMTHTLFPSTFYAVNGAYWSLGLEWQLYLTLPLLIIAVRRIGIVRTLAAVVAVNVVYRLAIDAVIHSGAVSGLSATAVLPNLFAGRWAEFGFGMLAAELYTRRRLGRWTSLAGVLAALMVPVAVHVEGSALEHILFGAIFFALLVMVLKGGTVVSRVAGWRPLAALGTMSYSLYLVHQPIVQALAWTLRSHGVAPNRTFDLLVLCLPIILAVATLLFVTVERRTLSSGARSARRLTDADAASARVAGTTAA